MGLWCLFVLVKWVDLMWWGATIGLQVPYRLIRLMTIKFFTEDCPPHMVREKYESKIRNRFVTLFRLHCVETLCRHHKGTLRYLDCFINNLQHKCPDHDPSGDLCSQQNIRLSLSTAWELWLHGRHSRRAQRQNSTAWNICWSKFFHFATELIFSFLCLEIIHILFYTAQTRHANNASSIPT